ncbi:MAG: potassium transporter Kup [bacterium]
MEKISNKASANTVDDRKGDSLRVLVLAALGVVFGDIATSPLYAIRECFHGEYGITPNPDNVLGVLSLMFWALTIIVGVKYLTFILRADNQGEGGVIALTSLIQKAGLSSRRGKVVLVALGLFGASLLYGDGMITPAISVLSAVEGVQIITPVFRPYVIPATVAILLGLFVLQHRGTARIGSLFGPIVLVWLSLLTVLGLRAIVQSPQVLTAIAPWHGMQFLIRNQFHGFLVLGAVFLVVTGTEALYADLGHFGKKPIRLAWFSFVLPALLCNYFGQGAVLLLHPEQSQHPFYALVPGWGMIPMVIFATAATIIASQAVITGSFSLTRQAVQMGYLPRLRIAHTSTRHIGQIYVPIVNWVLMFATIGLVLGLGSSSKLAAAYGVAVTSTMLISTILFFVVARHLWNWRWWAAAIPAALFLIVDLSFFVANISKLLHGAWFPLVIGTLIFALMTTWQSGRRRLAAVYLARGMSWSSFWENVYDPEIQRVEGAAIYLSGNPDLIPPALLHNIEHNRDLHSRVALLHVAEVPVPRVPNAEKVELTKLSKNIHRIVAHYGYMESPNVPNILSLAREQGVEFDVNTTSFFLGRERLESTRGSGMALWRKRLFAFMSRNALDIIAFFGIPADRVVEVGVRLKL